MRAASGSAIVIKKIKVPDAGLDGIMCDEFEDKLILTNHSRPIGTLVAIDPDSGNIVGAVELEDISPEGAAPNGTGSIYVNNEEKNTVQIVHANTWKALNSWLLTPMNASITMTWPWSRSSGYTLPIFAGPTG